MKKLSSIVIGLVLAVANTQAQAYQSAGDKLSLLVEDSFNCSRSSTITIDSMFGNQYSVLPFLFNKNVCIYNIDAKKSVNTNQLSTNEEVFKMVDRYTTAIKNIDSNEDRLNFVKLFLEKASRKHFITESMLKKDDSIVVSVWGKRNNGKLSGEILKLIDRSDVEQYQINNSDLSNSEPSEVNADEIQKLVNYVINGKKKFILKS
ncbi:hypothetical protein [Thalassotalea profundi]|uniref:Uncharacterized protein n=1 Tax=Thalassotalea profundi TaxID=2036687 RepID=A0ABQ3IGU8_9GAMM|nr:hypothetical protein [Thalassotalea profundi]GHE84015.1 hypothetical protein GCM10011501_10910 [Thalassotalea profundi]